MTATQQRQNLLSLLEQARSDGATLDHACVQIGLTARSVQRWRRPVVGQSDRRISGKRHARPTNSASLSGRLCWRCSIAMNTRICRLARWCRAWPISRFIWPANPRCIACCVRLGNSRTGGPSVHHKSAASRVHCRPRSPIKFTVGTLLTCQRRCAASTSTCTCGDFQATCRCAKKS